MGITGKRILTVGEPLFLQRCGPLFDKLADHVCTVELLSSRSVGPSARLRLRAAEAGFIAARLLQHRQAPSWHGLRSAREQFGRSPAAFALKSKLISAAIAKSTSQPDLILHLFSLFSCLPSAGVPFVHYLDNTAARSQAPENEAAFENPEEFEAWFRLERDSYQRAAHVFTASELVRQSVITDYGIPSSKVSAIGASGNFRDVDRRERSYGSRRVVLNASDFQRKGGDIALAAFEAIRRSEPRARLIVLGTTFSTDAPHVEIVGRVGDRGRLAALLRSADIVIAPSRADPFPGFVIEAMNHGCVPVVSPRDGMPEIVGFGACGVVLPELTADALAASVSRLLNDRAELARFGTCARAKVASDWNWANVAKRMAATLETLAVDRAPALR